MKCKICFEESQHVFSQKILGKYDVKYYRCGYCFFLQTENPYWLEEAYSKGAIGALDVGIMSRNELLTNISEKVITSLEFEIENFIGIDYGGGHGIFVRKMRDIGYNFYRQDLYAENLYAQFFDIVDLPSDTKFDILTAFEVFEHIPNPIEEILKMFKFSDTLLFSTILQPSNEVKDLKEWWYIVPEGGQHVSFYHEKTLEQIAKILKVNFYTDSVNFHVLTKMDLNFNPLKTKLSKKRIKYTVYERIILNLHRKINKKYNNPKINNKSLISKDFEFVKNKINSNEN